jgi:hypothetical protein
MIRFLKVTPEVLKHLAIICKYLIFIAKYLDNFNFTC